MTSKQLKQYLDQMIITKGEKAIFGIQLFLTNKKALTRKQALLTLGKLKREKVEHLIINALTDESSLVKKTAIKLLGSFKSLEAIEPLNLILNDMGQKDDLRNSARAALAQIQDDKEPMDKEKIFGVYEFNNYVNEIISFDEVQIEGEVSGLQISHFQQNQWVFFDLKDEKKEAKISCFATTYVLRASRLSLVDGMRVIIKGKPRVSVKSGFFRVTVESVRLSGEGEIKRAFDLLKQKLETEGLFEPLRKRPVSILPQHIGLITSRDAAAYTDFVKVLKGRMGGMNIYFAHSQVQGQQAVETIVQALDYLNSYSSIELIVLTRGGGAMDDLHAFNSEEVARAIFKSRIPVVSAVGHERDITIADMVADVRASTPSNAAELIVPNRLDLNSQVDSYFNTIASVLDNDLTMWQRQLEDSVYSIESRVTAMSDRIKEVFRTLSSQVSLSGERIIQAKNRLEASQRTLVSYVDFKLRHAQQDLESTTRIFKNFDYKTNLQRGYSIIRKNGKIIKSKKDMNERDLFQVQLADGEVNLVLKKQSLF